MEFVAQPKRVLPLILLVDTSSSMSCCMEELNTAIRNMLEILKEQESLKAEVHVSFITFGNGGANLHIALRPIHNIEFKDFVAAQKELSANKILFTTKISKSNEEKFVLIDRGDILSKVLKREEIKENIKGNQNKKNYKNI